jgi:hypothetical protein
LALAEQDFGFTEFADDLFGGGSFTRHMTSLQSLILTLHLDQFLGVRSLLVTFVKHSERTLIPRPANFSVLYQSFIGQLRERSFGQAGLCGHTLIIRWEHISLLFLTFNFLFAIL